MRTTLTALILLLVVACAAPAAHASTAMWLDDPITDNYKASYNANPSQPELRTWLAVRSITAAQTTWRPADPAQILVTSGGVVTLTGDDGRTATLRVQGTRGPVAPLLMRTDPTSEQSGGRWGPLATLTDQAMLRTTPAQFSLTLTQSDGTQLATGVVSYRYDAALAKAPHSSIEYNGPGGRWWVGLIRTRTNWEPVPAHPPSLIASSARPRITRMQLPVRTTRRVVSMRVQGRNADGVRITFLRVRIDGRRWGAWIRTRRAYTLVVGATPRTHIVRVQLRDAAGRPSTVAVRRMYSH